jgi:hypothetical protein
MNAALAWIVANPITVTAVVVWLVANVAPRPNPTEMSSKWKVFWVVVDRLCFLTAGKLPGGFKMLFLASPAVATLPLPAPEAPPKKDEVP